MPKLAISEWEVFFRLSAAAVFGGLIGVERERIAWAAGLRTHMLVCVGSSLVMIVSAFGFADALIASNIALDPSRMAAQVVSGIGFMGAGYILTKGEIVRGLTTAASLWSVAAIGLAAGAGLYVPAAAATGIILVILAAAKPLEEWLQHRNLSHDIHLRVDHGMVSLQTLETALGYRASRISRFTCIQGADLAIDDLCLTLIRLPQGDIAEIREALSRLPHVQVTS
jgi:putative Mg2+ transporter-C (MgtC) family protein